MLRGLAAAIVILCLAMTVSAGAAPRGGTPDAEQRYRACMDQVRSDAGQASRTAEEWRRQGGGDAARHCAAAADLALGRFAEAGEGLEALARDGSYDSRILRASLFGQAAHAFLAADMPDRAEAAAAEALKLAPRDATLLVLKARALAGQHRFGEAIADLDQAIAVDPKLADAYVFRASALRQDKALESAAADLDQAIAVDPKLADAYVFRASALRQDKALESAAADLDQALSLEPQHPEALLERGIVRLLKGDGAGARADWQALIAADPASPAAASARLDLERLDRGE